MPVYVYECPRCKKQVESTETVAEHENQTHYCGDHIGLPGFDPNGVKMTTVIHAPGLNFKGSGWTPKFGR